jgi:superfamily II DNA/RNA helicase
MSSKFFTNRTKENSLNNRFNQILSNYEIQNLEFLIGYFRISGFNKIANLIKSDKIKNIRILVGLNVDKTVFNSLETFKNEQINELQNSKYSKNIDESVLILIDLLKNKKLEIRISKERNLHSKVYIFREKEILNSQNQIIDFRGSVITGSSNLTANGLENQHEFNVELRDSDDIKFAFEEFNFLWEQSEEITASDVQEIKQKSYLKEYSPFEIYMKFLTEYFEDNIQISENLADVLPSNFYRLKYQEDAVNEAIVKLKKYNGIIIGDVVGLGKTIVSSWVIKKLVVDNILKFNQNILIVTPPSLKENWQKSIKKFNISNVEFITTGSLEKVEDSEKIGLVLIDESHKFRTNKSKMYENLQYICKNGTEQKKVILLSATPINNSPEDFKNQIHLFQDLGNSTIDGFEDLDSFFQEPIKIFKNLKTDLKNKKIDFSEAEVKIKNISKKLNKLVSKLIIRRTRGDLENSKRYSEDLKKQKIFFPKQKLENLDFNLTENQKSDFERTVQIIEHELIYSRFKAHLYLKTVTDSENAEKGIHGLMKTFFIKRFESSFDAFKQSVNRQIEELKNIILNYTNDKQVIIGAIEDIENRKVFERKDLKKDYIFDIQKDLKLFQELKNIWENLSSENDPKLKTIVSLVENLAKSEKLIIFSESKDTVKYISEILKNITQREDIYSIFGTVSQANKKIIANNFDANIPPHQQINDFNILITTDILAEGVNLHRAFKLINYDIPWNATKLMQRIGRINRIGSVSDTVFVYNFRPFEKSDDEIHLEKITFLKLQTFHDIFGEDNASYSEELETVKSLELFDELVVSESDEVNPELEFFEELQNFRELNPKEFKNILKIKNKIRVQKSAQIKSDKNITFVFLKNRGFRKIYKIKSENIENSDFISMAKKLKSDINEKAILPISDVHYSAVETLFSDTQTKQNFIKEVKTSNNKSDKNLKIINNYLRKLSQNLEVSEEEINAIYSVRELIKLNKFVALKTEIIKLMNSKINDNQKIEQIFELNQKYKNNSSEQNQNNQKNSNLKLSDSEIILSFTLL